MAVSSGDLAVELDTRLRSIAERLPSGTVGVCVSDYLSGAEWSFNGDRWFHAASIMKIAVLAALFDAVDQGRFTLDCRLHVRNRFRSAVDRVPFRVDPGRDADADVHAALGRTMRLRELARQMIVKSSNLATNLLLNLVGLDATQELLRRLQVTGFDVCRGVEDDRAFDQGINNRVTPNGAAALLKAIVDGRAASRDASASMLDLLHDQQFTGTIAPGLPETIRAAARVAHKTGEISTVTHDAGIVFLPGRPPYVVAIMVESTGDLQERTEVATAVSTAVYECVAAAGEGAGR
jgi:beta-lactamase class A